MKVTHKMVDKQLRTRGMLFNLLVKKSNEEKFIASMHHSKKRMEKSFRGKDVKGLDCSEDWVKRSDGSSIRVRIYRPLHQVEDVPGVLWLHGGGYAQGLPEMSGEMYKRLIQAGDCVIVAPDYRLSIEAPYPAALEDAYDVLLWMKDNAHELGIRNDQLMAGGESAGGGLTAALTLYARDKGEVNIAFQMPLYPMIDDRMVTESARENNAYIWDTKMNRWAWKLYLGDLYGKEVPVYAAPARAEDYSSLPPAATFVGDIEPFRDETITYVENLKQNGTPVDFEIYKGAFHGFDIIHPKAKISRDARDFLMNAFQYAVKHYFAAQKK
ncbi:alpha/beta hydrolase [Alkalicoccus daliensis]|uniref:Acetyl esterase/lipase n=1 Tax=Alkalicoccus daliensis TaxID=745820 RepID=A0A1H0JXK2_9BACI|nr:alpha/beta hydrolase [Alkalicoccus daliensis]SDO48242.1 Acetyl esterase/lipase [Alkalicoccus daliensis]